jgi:hypothetical protein
MAKIIRPAKAEIETKHGKVYLRIELQLLYSFRQQLPGTSPKK